MENNALVVQGEDEVIPLGILTAMDIVQNAHNLAIDCISPKTNISPSESVENALALMHKENTDVLSVYNNEKFEGLVYKNDLINFLYKEKYNLEQKVAARNSELNKIYTSLESSQRVLKALFDSTTYVKLLVSYDHKLMFFNKKAYVSFISWFGLEMKIDDNILDYIPDNHDHQLRNSFIEEFQRALNGETISVERKIMYNHTQGNWFRIEYVPVYEMEYLIGIAINFVDINESKKYDLHIEQQNIILREIAWIQSHKMRGPVATILGLINLLEVKELSEDNQEIVRLMRLTVKELDEVIHKIVDKTNELDEVM